MSLQNLIAQEARRRGLDPHAVLAVASVEGGFRGAIGDQGTSFGPFQLHVGGALPRGRGNNWANSRVGIMYALDQIAKVARGKTGRAAIESIVRRFERPAAPDAEINKAFSRYGKVGGGEAGSPSAALAARPQAAAPNNTRHEAISQLVMALGEDHPDISALIPLVAAAKAQPHVEARIQRQTPVAGNVTEQDARVVATAKKWLGTPYVWGGTTKQGVDCSALLQRVWGDAGVKIPRVTYDQWKTGQKVGKGQLRAGDAVFFHMGKRGPEHVGMYIGNGKFIEAPRTGLKVRVSTLAGRSDYVGARRYG